MRIDRERVFEAFALYTGRYDSGDEKIKLKIDHTYRVSELCERIAKAQGLTEEETEISWLTGMLHDIGRFEQLRNYNTFNDALSVNHAQYGADILFLEGKIKEYISDFSENELIEKVIRLHNTYRLPDSLSKRERVLSEILRDADKIDILKVNVEVPLEEIYNITTKELRNAAVTDEVMESIREGHATVRSLKRTAADHLVGHISLVFELVFPVSFRIVKEQGYLEKLMEFQSENRETQLRFEEIRKLMKRFMEERTGEQ
ncbi:MAG TPA: HD domain-containing protein [Lachnospiraceae bacterium]|nr:HD domain-containing protein [Lachnospiraceae bacterium]